MNRTAALRHAARRLGLRAALQRTGGALGFDVVRRDFYSPVPDWRAEPPARWSTPSAMPGVAFDLDAQRATFEQDLAPRFPEFTPPVEPGADPAEYHYANGFFGPLDADVLHAVIRWAAPGRVVELGSGHSTTVIAAAAAKNAADGSPLRHDVYDPFAREELRTAIRASADLHLVSAVDVPLARFEELEAGDVLFVDTTHTVKLGSDVNFVILEVLPRLRPGVLVHIHDIFLPWEYPKAWFSDLEVYWAEQYLLQAYLSGNDRYEVVLGNAALAREHPDVVARAVPQMAHAFNPGSMWLRAR
ncbi:class I SAM-dependent methyltransferase [Patulibacter sp.]|uniref:class I SAM-dependent methyltransferase n=1 Tax=Patulibacter sp. TaxID=1912859 RepID=UPI002725EAB3|nr:class I SAM-dependent methyltransferase [Patulibacter sp.]MDO9407668.1 class I SAM-dependent methyltransferase [Patulibacter sp.]